MLGAFVIFLVVFLLNLIPAFAPPTWMVLSYLGLRYSNGNIPAFALIAAVAATPRGPRLTHYLTPLPDPLPDHAIRPVVGDSWRIVDSWFSQNRERSAGTPEVAWATTSAR